MIRNQKAHTLEGAVTGEYTVVSLEGGTAFTRRLADMGIFPGSHLGVVSSGRGGGPIVLSVKGSRIGIGRGMAARILVKRRDSQSSVEQNGEESSERLLTLRDYLQGQKGRILDIRGEGRFKKRILEMGFVKGAEVYVEKYAPLRDPVEFIIKGYHVSLRRDEAERIIMSDPQETTAPG
jgi:Fur family ferric uptake transcriptional regulator